MKSINFNKKAQGFGINKMLVLVLVILAVGLGFLFLFKADILRLIRNIGPDYNIPEDEIDVGETPEESYKIQGTYLSVQNDKLALTVYHTCDEIKFKILAKRENLVKKILWIGSERLWREGVFSGKTKKISLLEPSGEGESKSTGKFEEGVYYAKTFCLKKGGETGEEKKSNKVGITQKILEDAENYEPPKLLDLMKSSSDCVCGENCEEYAGWIEKYSEKYGIDDFSLVLSMMIQESRCDSSRISESNAVGLMQLMKSTVEDKNTGCTNMGINFEDVKTSSEKNIECGLYILKSKYNLFNHDTCTSKDDCPHPFNIDATDKKPALKLCNKEFCLTDCVEKVCEYQFIDGSVNEYYSGWKAVLRAYPGWGRGHPNYVTEIDGRYAGLGGTELA